MPSDYLHFSTFLDLELSKGLDDVLKTSPFMNQKLPVAKAILSEWTVEADGYSWNDRYQASIESVLAMQRKAAAMSPAIEPTVAAAAATAEEETMGPLLSAYFSYFATYGSFLGASRRGVSVEMISTSRFIIFLLILLCSLAAPSALCRRNDGHRRAAPPRDTEAGEVCPSLGCDCRRRAAGNRVQ